MLKIETPISTVEQTITKLLQNWQFFQTRYTDKDTFIKKVSLDVQALLDVANILCEALNVIECPATMRDRTYQQLMDRQQNTLQSEPGFDKLTRIKNAIDNVDNLEKLKNDYQACEKAIIKHVDNLQKLCISCSDSTFSEELKTVASKVDSIKNDYILPFKQQLYRISPVVEEEIIAIKGITLSTVTKIITIIRDMQIVIAARPLAEFYACIEMLQLSGVELAELKKGNIALITDHQESGSEAGINLSQNKSILPELAVTTPRRKGSFLSFLSEKISPRLREKTAEKTTDDNSSAVESTIKQLSDNVIAELKKR